MLNNNDFRIFCRNNKISKKINWQFRIADDKNRNGHSCLFYRRNNIVLSHSVFPKTIFEVSTMFHRLKSTTTCTVTSGSSSVVDTAPQNAFLTKSVTALSQLSGYSTPPRGQGVFQAPTTSPLHTSIQPLDFGNLGQ
jgi:hypothetical protein